MGGDLASAIEKNRDKILEFAREMISFKTDNPPAHNTKDMQLWLEERLKELGMKTEMMDLYPGEPVLAGSLHRSKNNRTLIFNGHVDVAQINPDENWEFDPFTPWCDDTYLYGRGASDMKAGMAAAYWAIKTVLESGAELKNGVMFQSVIGEEAGEHGTKLLLENGHKGDFAIIPEPTELNICGQGGVVTMWVIIKSPETYHDGLRSRMIHAGGGIDGASAIEKMYKILYGMQELERYWAVTKGYPGLKPGANTINPAVVKGGRHPAFIADECSMWFTIHYLPDEKLEDIKNEIMSYINDISNADPWLKKNRPEIIFGGTSMFRDKGEIFPASEVQKENEDVRNLFDVYKKVLNRDAESIVWPSVSDSGWFSEFDVPVVILGPGLLEEAHSINEKIEIQQIMDAAKIYASYIFDFCVR